MMMRKILLTFLMVLFAVHADAAGPGFNDTTLRPLTSASLSVDISTQTNLTATGNLSLSGDTLSISDSFLLNTGDTGTGNYFFNNARVQIPNATTLPALCSTGEMYMDTDATTGQRFYLCEAGTWTVQGDGSGTGDITSVGNVASGAAFDGTQGTTLTFNDADGDQTLAYDTTNNKFVLSDNLSIGSAGVDMTTDGDGAITFLGLGNGSDEDLTINLDDTSNHIVLSSSTSVTDFDLTSIDLLVGGSDVSLGSAGVKLTGDGDGAITFLGMGDGSDEDLTINLDDTSNHIVLSSSTSVTDFDLTSIDLLVGGSDVSLGSAGVKLTGDGDGAITLLGMGDGSDEDLTMNLDDTSNNIVFSSSTGVTIMDYGTLGADYDSATLEVPNSTALPGTCTIGQIYMDTDATSGQRLYFCNSADSWGTQGEVLSAVMSSGYVLYNSGTDFTGNPVLTYDEGTNILATHLNATSYFSIGGSKILHTGGGVANTSLGVSSGTALNLGTNNLFVGVTAGMGLTNGDRNVFIGQGAGEGIEGDNNVFVGTYTAISALSGNANVYLGNYAGNQNDTGADNVFIGSQVAAQVYGGNKAVVIGFYAGYSMISDSPQNILIGYYAGVNTDANENTIIGNFAGSNTTVSNNVFIGDDAGGLNLTGTGNVIVGSNADLGITGHSGVDNVYIGYNAAAVSTTGDRNIVIGSNCFILNTSGDDNIVMGRNTGNAITSAAQNIIIGSGAGAALVSGTTNTLIGTAAGAAITGSGNVCVGYNACGQETGSNKLYIDNSNTTTPLIGGDFSANTVTITGALSAIGVVDFGGATSTEVVNGTAPTVDAAGEIAVDTTDDQLIYFSTAKRVIPYERTVCVTKDTLASTDDNMPIYMFGDAATITAVGCSYIGTGTTPATITLEDGGGNGMTITGTNPTCVAHGTNATFAAVTAGNGVVAGEVVRFDTTNTPDPTTDKYTICVAYTVDAQ